MNFQNIKLLLVEDNPNTRKLIEVLLISLGIEHITQAENGKQALEILNNHTFDIILTDWWMPKLTGLELLKRIRASPPPLRDTKMIMITFTDNEVDVKQAKDAGIDGYIVKPFTQKAVISALEATLSS